MSEAAPNLPREAYAKALPENTLEWGFEIHELGEQKQGPLPISEVLADVDEIARAAVDAVESGQLRIEAPTATEFDNVFIDVPKGPLQALDTDGDYFSKYSFDADDVKTPEARTWIESITKEKIHEAAVFKAYRELDREHTLFDDELYDDTTDINQIFNVENGRGGSFRIYNFSETLLEGETLAKMVNAIREKDQLTGGRVTQDVEAIGIFPETNKRWGEVGEAAAEKTNATSTIAYTIFGRIAMSEKLIKHKPEGKIDEKNDAFAVGNKDVGAVLFHELTHIEQSKLDMLETTPAEKFGWRVARNSSGYIEMNSGQTFNGVTESPSEYGTVSAEEDTSESATALFVGGEWSKALNDERVVALEGLYASLHTKSEGPAYIRCEELDLHAIAADSKLGTHIKPGAVFRPRPQYSFKYEPVEV